MTALIELDNVRKAFGSVIVADGLSFSVAAGELLGVVGPNGAGKTSTLNLITGTIPLDGGRILFEGRDLSSLPAHERARIGIGRTYQVPRPFVGMTVFENVLLAASYAGAERVDGSGPIQTSGDVLSDVGLIDRANAMAGSLSLYDRKRLELARALATHPKLLLLDEIAGGLSEPEMAGLIDQIRLQRDRGLGIIWIEHVVQALVSGVDRLIAMDYGRLLAEGDPAKVIADPRVQAVYMGQELEMVEP